MLRILGLILLVLPLQSLAQDTMYYDTLIKTQAGDFVKVKSKSELTGLIDTYTLQQGNWQFYSVDGVVLKEARYKADVKNKVSSFDGDVIFYDLTGEKVLSQVYKNGALVSSSGFKETTIIQGITQVDIRIEYGEYKVFQHQDRFKQSKIQTQYANLRGANELAYYLNEEERLSSPHLLDTAPYWPNRLDNLISNPMFEDHPSLSTSMASFTEQVDNWRPVTPTPDFFLSEDCKSGTGCIGFRVYSLVKDIEYVQNRLRKPLKKDSLYCFSIYVKLANQCSYTSNGLGAHFSKKPVDDVTAVINSEPDILLNESYLPYKTKWMLLQCRYKAKGGEKYVTIGSFKRLDDIALTKVNGYSAEAYYIMDDATLTLISDSSDCKCNLDNQPVNLVVTHVDTAVSIGSRIDTLSVGDRFVLENVYFDNDKSDLLPESIVSLTALFKLLQSHVDLRIEIGGHTSAVGGYEHNMKLSEDRAKAVKRFLIVQGVDKSRLRIEGYGPNEPIDSNDTVKGQAKNRRVEIKILDK